jgi:hypothetical protein
MQLHGRNFLLKNVFLAVSPEASGPIVQFIVQRLLLGVGQPRKHPWRSFPGNFALFVDVPHRVTRFFEFPKNLGDQLGSGAAWAVIFDPLIFNMLMVSSWARTWLRGWVWGECRFSSCNMQYLFFLAGNSWRLGR